MTKTEIIKEYFSKMGKKGGSKGGITAAAGMTPRQRTERAKMAAAARWAKKARKTTGAKGN
jgi:hypothetical protein